MKVLNFKQVFGNQVIPGNSEKYARVRVHRKNMPDKRPKVSVIMLDWSCRERFHSLDWLLKQDAPRESYELIWVELYGRLMAEALEKADTVITCNQKGMYHKHIGYNVSLLNSHGEIIVICDSDAVYPPDFISSVIRSFYPNSSIEPQPLVLMHYELRTSSLYPEGLRDTEELKDDKWRWWPLNPNVGACMSVRKQDAVRFGGFDEHESFRGYLCGPYDLGWRLVNAGIPERWHDTTTVLWHFAHPDPVGVNELAPTLKRMWENTYPHVDLHALTAVEALVTGRLLPLTENPDIFKLRMTSRRIGTRFEEKYARMITQKGFLRWHIFRLRVFMVADIFWTVLTSSTRVSFRKLIEALAGKNATERLRGLKHKIKSHMHSEP
ncbi:MAG: hypothetical protein Q8R48_05290, partial [Candidatus Omnitrophota bacterium]|nr:hypothetical protein [Candidatus Omnitrophota bacterium]